jgi:3-hydroxyisobutyrate dehydrogenase-like beta-hydroxyacid dehydrogenase
MGTGMAFNLLKAGHEVTVYNRTRARAAALVAQGAAEAEKVAEVCRGDAVFSMVAGDNAVEGLAFGAGGIMRACLPARSIFPCLSG